MKFKPLTYLFRKFLSNFYILKYRKEDVSSSACASPSLSIATVYDQFNLQIKFEDEGRSMSSPAGSFPNAISTNNLSTTSVTFTQPPLPIHSQQPFVNGGTTSQVNGTTSCVGNGFQSSIVNSTPQMQNPGYFDGSNSPFTATNQTPYESECHCKTGYTCSKCFQKAMEL